MGKAAHITIIRLELARRCVFMNWVLKIIVDKNSSAVRCPSKRSLMALFLSISLALTLSAGLVTAFVMNTKRGTCSNFLVDFVNQVG